MPKSKKRKLTPLPKKNFNIRWNNKKTACTLERKGRKPVGIGCGITDTVSVYSNNGKTLVLSVNYPARYACLESFTVDGLEGFVFAESKDIDDIFGETFPRQKQKAVAVRLLQELD